MSPPPPGLYPISPPSGADMTNALYYCTSIASCQPSFHPMVKNPKVLTDMGGHQSCLRSGGKYHLQNGLVEGAGSPVV